MKKRKGKEKKFEKKEMKERRGRRRNKEEKSLMPPIFEKIDHCTAIENFYICLNQNTHLLQPSEILVS